MLRSHGVGSVTREGNLSTEHLEEDDAKGIDIDAGIDWQPLHLLGCHVGQRAENRARRSEAGAEELRDPEVEDLDQPVATTKEICRFEIAMN